MTSTSTISKEDNNNQNHQAQHKADGKQYSVSLLPAGRSCEINERTHKGKTGHTYRCETLLISTLED
jgi:hypothetical protein